MKEVVSFSIVINLLKTKNNSYVVFKPFVSITADTKQAVEHLVKKYRVFYQNGTEVLLPNGRTKLVLQKVDVVQQFVKKYEDTPENFTKALELLNENGSIFKKYSPLFPKLIELKLSLNENVIKRTGKKEWLQKIQKHLE